MRMPCHEALENGTFVIDIASGIVDDVVAIALAAFDVVTSRNGVALSFGKNSDGGRFV